MEPLDLGAYKLDLRHTSLRRLERKGITITLDEISDSKNISLTLFQKLIYGAALQHTPDVDELELIDEIEEAGKIDEAYAHVLDRLPKILGVLGGSGKPKKAPTKPSRRRSTAAPSNTSA